MNDVKRFLEMVRKKRDRVRRLKENLTEHTAQAESVGGLALTERVQTSNQITIDAILANLEEERKRLEESVKELEEMTERAKQMINLIRDDEVGWEILWSRYVIGRSWKDIDRRIGYDERQRRRIVCKMCETIGEKMSGDVRVCPVKS